jgi:hypothetical protein
VVRLPVEIVRTGSGAHPASYQMGTGATSPGIKRQGREADHSPSSCVINNEWNYASTPLHAFTAYVGTLPLPTIRSSFTKKLLSVGHPVVLCK